MDRSGGRPEDPILRRTDECSRQLTTIRRSANAINEKRTPSKGECEKGEEQEEP